MWRTKAHLYEAVSIRLHVQTSKSTWFKLCSYCYAGPLWYSIHYSIFFSDYSSLFEKDACACLYLKKSWEFARFPDIAIQKRKKNKKRALRLTCGSFTTLWKRLCGVCLYRDQLFGGKKEKKNRDSMAPLFIPIFLPQRPGNTAVLNKDSVGESWPAYFLGRRDCFFELSQQRRLSSTGVGPFIVFLLLEETCRESARVVQLLLLYLETELFDTSGIYAPTTRCCRCCSIHWSCYQRCCCGLGAVGTSWVRRSSWISRGTYQELKLQTLVLKKGNKCLKVASLVMERNSKWWQLKINSAWTLYLKHLRAFLLFAKLFFSALCELSALRTSWYLHIFLDYVLEVSAFF